MITTQTSADGGRTETKRFDDAFSSEELIEGDRIAPEPVARTIGQYGKRIKPFPPKANEADKPAKTQLVAATSINRMDDTHSALLVDPETGVIVRAGCHNSNSAWSQKKRDCIVYEVGTTVVVNDVKKLEVADNDEPVEDEHKWVQGWADILFGDLRHGHFDYDDERSLGGSTLTLEDFEGREAVATISLDDE